MLNSKHSCVFRSVCSLVYINIKNLVQVYKSPLPNIGVIQAFVAFGTQPDYLNPSAHSAVKPWHGGSSFPIFHPRIWQ